MKHAAPKPEHGSGQTEIMVFQHAGQVLDGIFPILLYTTSSENCKV